MGVCFCKLFISLSTSSGLLTMKLEKKNANNLNFTLFFLQLDASTECDRYMGYASKERFVYFYSYIVCATMGDSTT